MGKGEQNRPFKYGAKDRREFIVQDSEVSYIAINDTNGNPVFLGRSKTGVSLDENKWQIRKITYDSAQGITRVTWPEDSDGLTSSDFEFSWTEVSALTITDISNAATGVVTVAAIGSLTNGDKIVIQNVAGMTEVNFDGTNIYTVANIAANTFELSGINTTAYTAYSSGGTVSFGEVVNYTYS
jgi:hypothetical protein